MPGFVVVNLGYNKRKSLPIGYRQLEDFLAFMTPLIHSLYYISLTFLDKTMVRLQF